MNWFPSNLGCGCFCHAPPIHGIWSNEMKKFFFCDVITSWRACVFFFLHSICQVLNLHFKTCMDKHTQIPPDGRCRSHMMQYHWWYCEFGVLLMVLSRVHYNFCHVAAVYSQNACNSTPTCNSLSGNASYETYIADQGESGCVYVYISMSLKTFKGLQLDAFCPLVMV